MVEQESETFFDDGDSRPIAANASAGRSFDIDLGVLAIGSGGRIYEPESGTSEPIRWYKDENQMREAARDLKLTRLLPFHWDMWRGVGSDPTALHEYAASYKYPRVFEVEIISDKLDVGESGVEQAETLRR